MGRIDYSSNNSGGSFWLKDADWRALERAGWIVHWLHDWNDPDHTHAEPVTDKWSKKNHHHGYSDPLLPANHSGEDWLGASATHASKEVSSKGAANDAIDEFEAATGQNAGSQGCNCCGPPHSFTYYDDNDEPHYFDVYPTEYKRGWS